MPRDPSSPASIPGTASQSVRIDKWLWAVRLYKTRSLAADACRNGRVRINDAPVRASREVRAGEVIEARCGDLRRRVRVRAVLEDRIGAPRVPEYLEDLTPPEEYERVRVLREASGAFQRDRGAGRPTKRDRRLMEAFLDLPLAPSEPGTDAEGAAPGSEAQA